MQTLTKPIEATTRQTTALLKKHLKTAYGISCKINSESYSGGSSLNVSYSLGVDKKVIEKYLKALQYGNVDSMTEGYDYKSEKEYGLVINGFSLNTYKFVFVSQYLSPEFRFKLAKFVSDNLPIHEVPALQSFDQFNDYFKESLGAARTWKDIIYQGMQNKHFITQDEEKIVLKSVHHSSEGLNQYYFIYTVDGVEYNTEISNIKPLEK